MTCWKPYLHVQAALAGGALAGLGILFTPPPIDMAAAAAALAALAAFFAAEWELYLCLAEEDAEAAERLRLSIEARQREVDEIRSRLNL